MQSEPDNLLFEGMQLRTMHNVSVLSCPVHDISNTYNIQLLCSVCISSSALLKHYSGCCSMPLAETVCCQGSFCAGCFGKARLDDQ